MLPIPGLAEEADRWEKTNRKIFAFNEFFDRYALKPVAKGYKKVTPGWLNDMITRIFANLDDVSSGFNNVLQWEWHEAGNNFGRFGLNTTLGVVGMFDVATATGLRKYPDDLGLTLAKWGVGEGPYLVVPFLGSYTLRDTVWIWPGTAMRPVSYIEHDMTRWSVRAVAIVDVRADVLEIESAISGDRYIFMRDFYLQRRRLAAGQIIEDDFGAGGEDLDGDEWGTSGDDGW